MVNRAKHIASLLASPILVPNGFYYAGVAAHIKKNKQPASPPPLDLALIHSKHPCSVAASFTTNLFQAAPVKVSKQIIQQHKNPIHSVIINSGCANACTGHQGDLDAWFMSKHTSTQFSEFKSETLVMSTGVIGQLLDMTKVRTGIESICSELGTSRPHVVDTAKAFMTTDTFPKYLSRQVTLPDSQTKYTMLGICKGSGMIHPKLESGPPHATMLAVITTDLGLTDVQASTVLDHSVTHSFNCISVDGDTSTNDCVYLLANGMHTQYSDSDMETIRLELRSFCRDLASAIVWDGEGATKCITVRVSSHSTQVSQVIASSVATSSLVKTAMFGNDANWGRILCAVGYANVHHDTTLNADLVSLAMANSVGQKVSLVERGVPKYPIDELLCAQILNDDRIFLMVDMGTGTCEAEYDFCDFSHDYVSINADYRS